MSWRYHSRAKVNPQSPSGWATCDRCGRIYQRLAASNGLNFQYDWRGPRLENLRILVCQPCTDLPQEQLRPKILSADPLPIMNPRPEQYDIEVNTFLVLEGNAGILLVEAASPQYAGYLLCFGITINTFA